ncbi:MAG: Asp23/Gls24 family envelope stress response protein [Ruminococcus sp.]|nr:Asp23/Gls24 family envelope stress response protein [Ruminococcus sp.]
MSKENTGITRVSEDVVVSIATAAINDVKGVEKICTGAGIVKKIFTKDEPVSVKINGDVVEVNADVIIKQGYNASVIGEKIQESVKTEIQSAAGITVSRVNVTISGISFDKR